MSKFARYADVLSQSYLYPITIVAIAKGCFITNR